MRHKIIIDTDPGIDDAMAIFAALGDPGLELLGLTTTFGNVSVEQATRNALTLVEMAGRDLPVAAGVARPLRHAPLPYPDFGHGRDGFGNLGLPPPQRAALRQDAADFIVSQVLQYPGEITNESGCSGLSGPGCRHLLMVNTGDMLQEASGGYFPSTTHRVVNPPVADRSRGRISLPLFLHLRPEVVLSERHTAGSYLQERLKELGFG